MSSRTSNRLEYVSLLLSLSVASYAGEVLRVFFDKLFGTACHEPGTVGWNSGDWTPCTTAPGTTEATGGALFSDLPSNMMGCFLMGLFLDGRNDDHHVRTHVAVRDMPIIFLSRKHTFQKQDAIHFCIRTGFCGALTTFASWNTQMVIMICGGDGTELGSTQWVSALFGYMIGYMVAMQSYIIGRDVAVALHRRNNPQLRIEADAVQDGTPYLVINQALPDFERRYLHDIQLEALEEEEEQQGQPRKNLSKQTSDSSSEVHQETKQEEESSTSGIRRNANDDDLFLNLDKEESSHASQFHFLQEWKETTHRHRQGNSSYTKELHEIERNILVERQEPREELLEVARTQGWAVEALRNWKDSTRQNNDALEEKQRLEKPRMPQFLFAAFVVFAGSTAILVWVATDQSDSDNPVEVTYRTAALSALLSPLGTISRWQLSKLNLSVKQMYPKWHWVPLGTLIANMVACIVSAIMVALSLEISSPLALAFVDAIKTGYTGSLSTVATFVAETVALMQFLPRHGWAYYYAIGSIVMGCLLGIISYVWAVV